MCACIRRYTYRYTHIVWVYLNNNLSYIVYDDVLLYHNIAVLRGSPGRSEYNLNNYGQQPRYDIATCANTKRIFMYNFILLCRAIFSSATRVYPPSGWRSAEIFFFYPHIPGRIRTRRPIKYIYYACILLYIGI